MRLCAFCYGERGQHLMAASRQKLETAAHLLARIGLRQNAPSAGNHRIGGENECFISTPVLCNRLRFCEREPLCMNARQFLRANRFVDMRGNDGVGNDPGLRKQRFAARAFAREYEKQRFAI